jgi:hypothetical protein
MVSRSPRLSLFFTMMMVLATAGHVVRRQKGEQVLDAALVSPSPLEPPDLLLLGPCRHEPRQEASLIHIVGVLELRVWWSGRRVVQTGEMTAGHTGR